MDATTLAATETLTIDELINDPLSQIEMLTDEQLARVGGGRGAFVLDE